MLIRTLALAAMVAAASSAEAADANGRAAPKGFGLATCEQFLGQAKAENNETALRTIVSWVNGYITASNIYQENTYDMTPWQNPLYLLNVYARLCEQDPKQSFVAIVHYVNNALKPNRKLEQEEMIVAQAGERRIGVYKSILMDVQEALKEKGFLKGTADGAFGPVTQTALESYQRASELPVTGLPDSFTVERLLFANNNASGDQSSEPAETDAPAPAPAPQDN